MGGPLPLAGMDGGRDGGRGEGDRGQGGGDRGKMGGRDGGRLAGRFRVWGGGRERNSRGQRGINFGQVFPNPCVLASHGGGDEEDYEDDVPLIRRNVTRVTTLQAPVSGDRAEGHVGQEDELMQDMPEG
ncbi:uncharacterized protein LOC131040615 [Cryptomeria japonica]|uniref:uncharacterized protein LOC131040615 n=1 Tax=Cryptomeria japonica TaxID=3369 RepID=UPI0027DA813D|nr:uncharacterized protein LOC131040615 [Cryptomeria japonica]